MSNWSLKTPPTYFPTAVATVQGWCHPVTGEVLVAIAGLDTKNTDAAGVPTFTLAVPANGTYNAGQDLVLTVTASEPVEIVGAPSIDVTIGTNTRKAVYDAATSTSTSLKFKYTIQTGEVDADGIVVANVISLAETGKGKNKVVDKVADSTGVAVAGAALTFTVPDTTGILVA